MGRLYEARWANAPQGELDELANLRHLLADTADVVVADLQGGAGGALSNWEAERRHRAEGAPRQENEPIAAHGTGIGEQARRGAPLQAAMANLRVVVPSEKSKAGACGRASSSFSSSSRLSGSPSQNTSVSGATMQYSAGSVSTTLNSTARMPPRARKVSPLRTGR